MHPTDPHAMAITALAAAVALVLSLRLAQGGGSVGRAAAASVWLWFGAALALSVQGFVASPDRFALADLPGFAAFATLMALPVAALVALRRRDGAFARLVAGLPTPFLIALQTYRLGGAAFLVLVAEGRVPAWFGLATGAADLAVGLAALPVAAALSMRLPGSRAAALAWCALGLADFAHAIGYVLLAFAGLIAPDPAPAMIALHPLALIALFQVPLAAALHLEVMARLLRRPAAAAV